MNTLRLSSVPSPFVSSKMRMRSRALALGRAQRVGVRLGHPQAAAIVDREGDRPHDVGLGGGERHREPFGTVIARAASAPDRPACGTCSSGGSVVGVGGRDLVREERPRVVKAEVVEVDVRPGALPEVDGGRRAALVVHEADEDVAAGVRLEIDDRGAQQRAVRPEMV